MKRMFVENCCLNKERKVVICECDACPFGVNFYLMQSCDCMASEGFRKARIGFDEGPTYDVFTPVAPQRVSYRYPLFTKEVADKLAKDFGQENGENVLEYDDVEDSFRYYDENEETTVKFTGIDIEVNGKTEHVYPIGCGMWQWFEETDEGKEDGTD
jgi:hypothetical protein